MDEEQAAYDAVQAEKAELGLPPTPVEEPVEPAPAVEPVVEPKPEVAKTEEQPFDHQEYKDYKKTLREELQADFDKKLEDLKVEMAKSTPDETTITNLEDDIKKLAEETELDPDKVRKIIEVSRKGLETLTPDDKKLLEEYKQDKVRFAEESAEREQQEIDRVEWETILPTLKKDFPNASDEQLAKAREQLIDLAHNDTYHETDIDYVYFKEREALGKTLFSPRAASFESARPVAFESNTDFPDFSPNMTPEQFDSFEKRRSALLEGNDPVKVRITSRDDSGRVYEREE